MVSDWFEKDSFKQTVRQLLIDALKEIKVDFYGLDPIVQATLLDEAAQVGVQRSLQPLMRIKAVMEETNADENFKKQIVTEIYRERGKTLASEEVAKDDEATELFGLGIEEAVPNDAVGHPKQADGKADSKKL
jgi:hypothetical protein